MADHQMRALARRLHKIERGLLLTKQPQLGNSSIDDGALTAVDEDQNLTMIIGKQFDGTSAPTVVNGPIPPVPTAPTTTDSLAGTRVRWDGFFANGSLVPMDFARVEVHASTDSGFTAEFASTLVGTYETPRGGEIFVSLPPATHYIKLVTRSLSGGRSAASVGTATTPLAETTPAAPSTSPDFTLTGMPGSLLVRANNVPAGILLKYYISDTAGFTADSTTLVGVATRSTVYEINALANGTLLVEGVTYYVKIIATNGTSDAPASVEHGASVDMTAVRTLVLAELVAGFIMAGRIEVGAAYWDADQGLVFPQPDGGAIRLPVDGVTAAEITAHLNARSLSVADNANFYGTTQLFGVMKMTNGITNPVAAPGLSRGWSALTTDIASGLVPENYWGLIWENVGGNDRWTTVSYFYGAVFKRYNPTTGAVTTNTALTGIEFTPRGGLVRVGTDYYILGQDSSRSNAWYVYRYNSSLVKQSEFLFGSVANDPAIAYDGTNLAIGWVAANSDIKVRTLTTAGAQVGSDLTMTSNPVGGQFDMGALYVGSADFGAARIAIAARNGTSTFKVFNNSGVVQASSNWIRAGGQPVHGLAWDGTKFHNLDNKGRVWHYTAMPTATSVDGAYAWLDGVGTTHESMISPKTLAYSWAARSQLVVSMPPAPEINVASGADRAQQHTVYIGPAGGTVRLQATTAVGQTSVTLESLNTGSATPKTSNEFDLIAATPGRLESAAQNGSSVPHTKIEGNGSVRIAKALQAGVWATGTFGGVGTGFTKTQVINFDPQFDSAPSVNVDDDTAHVNVHSWATGISATQMTLNSYRDVSTTGVNVSWQAFAKTQ